MRAYFFLFMLPLIGIAAEPACLPTDVSRYCEGDTVYGLGPDGLFKPGKIVTLNKKTQMATWEGQELSLTELALIDRGSCQSVKLEPKRKHRSSPVCVGDQVTNSLETGLVLGKFPSGDLLLAGSGLPARRVKPNRFHALEKPELTRHDLHEAAKGVARINELLAQLSTGPCELPASDPPARPPLAQEQADCKDGDKPRDVTHSPQRKHFERLLVKGTSAPLEDFLKLWFPGEANGDQDSPYFECELGPSSHFREIPPGQEYKDPCRPDVLYSWGPRVKVDTITRNHQNGKAWTGKLNPGAPIGEGAVFASISAVSTVGYGPMLVRIKIKPETPVRGRGFGGWDGELSVRNDEFHDFVVKDASVVESISFGTPELYDEVVRDILRFKSGKRVSTYTPPGFGTGGIEGLNRLFEQFVDGHDQTELALKMQLLELIREILAGEGRVQFAEGVCQNRARHYATRNPNYINPYALSPAKKP